MAKSFIGGRGRRIAAALIMALSVGAAEGGASITISLVPANSTVQLGGAYDPVVLALEISNPDQLAIKSWSLDVAYDPAVFEPLPGIGTVPAQGFELGNYIPSVTPQWNPTFESDNIAPDVARGGVVNFAFTSGNDVSGVLAQLAFDAVGLGTGSTLSLSGEIILSSGAEVTDVVFLPAQVDVVEVPEPATLGGLMLGWAVIAYRRRRG